MIKYIDAHCHLTNNATLGDILTRATKINVIGAINNAAKISDWPDIIEISKRFHGVYGAIGIHPWYISDVTDNWSDIMQDLLLQNPQIQIGEIGLDNKHPNTDKQINFLVQQLQIAHNLQRGIFVHCVGMWNELFEILKSHSRQLPPYIVLHSYNGPIQNMNKISEKYNLYFSFSPRNLKSKKFAQYLTKLPVTRILAESDADKPDLVVNVIDGMAKILNIEHENLADIIYNNTIRILNNG